MVPGLRFSNDPVAKARMERRRQVEKVLVEYAAEKAIEQVLAGGHFILENPEFSRAWRLVGKLKELVERATELNLYVIRIDQCAFGLKGVGGGAHMKPTTLLMSSAELAKLLEDGRCTRDHSHEQVIGGSSVTAPAGHYPPALCKIFVDAMEKEFNKIAFGIGAEVYASEP